MKEFILSDGTDGAITDRAGERKLLPNREQIHAVTDLDWLVSFQDELLTEITKIETDLEFRPGDEDWAARARGALTAHQICRKHVEHRIRQLERGQKKVRPRGPANLEEKLRLKELKRIAHEAHMAEVHRGKIARAAKKAEQHQEMQKAQAQKKNHTIRIQIADTVRKANLAGHFMLAAKARFPAEVFQELIEAALKSQGTDIAEMISQQPE